MNHLLKNQLGFKGFIQSDWSATHSTVESVTSGLDMTMPGKKHTHTHISLTDTGTFLLGDITFNSGDSYFGANLTAAVKQGKVPEERITDMARRIVAAWYKVRHSMMYCISY